MSDRVNPTTNVFIEITGFAEVDLQGRIEAWKPLGERIRGSLPNAALVAMTGKEEIVDSLPGSDNSAVAALRGCR